MQKHTLGLWEVATNHDKSVPHPFESGPSDAAVLASGHGVAVMCSYLRGKEEQEANAYLIAAAPALLEALEQLMYHYDTGNGEPDWPKAITAIRKARGAE